MAFASGQRVTAAQLNNITWKTLEARSTGNETVDVVLADVNGATLTITTPVANTVVTVWGYFDVGTTGGTDTFIGSLNVDGSGVTTGEAHLEGAGSERATVAQSWEVTLASVGSHTLKLRRQKSSAADTVTLFSTHTKIKVAGLGIA